MSRRLAVEVETFLAQSGLLAQWARGLTDDDLAAPSVLPGWTVHDLLAHLARAQQGLASGLRSRSTETPYRAAEYVKRYAPAADEVAERARATAAAYSVDDLVALLRDTAPVRAATNGVADRATVQGKRGPITALDWVLTRTLELVVHCDDLSRSLPQYSAVPNHRAALAAVVRLLAEILAAQSPGRSVELRVPPFVAVQAVDGPRHTRGTPPNVVETEPLTWVRVATGRLPFAEAIEQGSVHASGNRADLGPYLPLLA